jgi:hypothetical protein
MQVSSSPTISTPSLTRKMNVSASLKRKKNVSASSKRMRTRKVASGAGLSVELNLIVGMMLLIWP